MIPGISLTTRAGSHMVPLLNLIKTDCACVGVCQTDSRLKN